MRAVTQMAAPPVDVNEITRKIWEEIYGPWDPTKKSTRTARYMKIGADEPRIDPITGVQIRTQKGGITNLSFKAPQAMTVNPRATITYKGKTTTIGYNSIFSEGQNPIKTPIIFAAKGHLMVNAEADPALMFFLDLDPHNANSPCYWPAEKFKSGSREIVNTHPEIVPSFKRHNATDIVMEKVRETKEENKIIGMIYAIKSPARIEFIAKALKLPFDTELEGNDATDALRYHIAQKAKKSPGEVMHIIKKVEDSGVTVIEHALMRGIIGQNGGSWWVRMPNSTNSSPMFSDIMPAQKDKIDEQIWVFNQLRTNRADLLLALEELVDGEEEEEEEEENDSTPLNKDGSPNKRFKRNKK